MKITEDLAPITYSLSKQVFGGSLSFKDAKRELVGKGRMNPNSAAYYINNFGNLITGKPFKRTSNAFITNYFFENILKDYGISGVKNALTSLIAHIKYYEGVRNTTLLSLRLIYDRYYNLSIDNEDEREQNELVSEIKQQSKLKQDIINELNSLKPTDPEVIIIHGRTYKRDNKTIAQIKILRDFKCQICSTSIIKRDGTFYVEAAHIKAKRHKGPESPDNIILLCPNHHKEFDLGKVDILEHDNNRIEITLNGVHHTLSLKLE